MTDALHGFVLMNLFVIIIICNRFLDFVWGLRVLGDYHTFYIPLQDLFLSFHYISEPFGNNTSSNNASQR
jgi:hypothetical protein